jgi:hypothetical protein
MPVIDRRKAARSKVLDAALIRFGDVSASCGSATCLTAGSPGDRETGGHSRSVHIDRTARQNLLVHCDLAQAQPYRCFVYLS